MRDALTVREALALPAVVDIVTAGRAVGIGRTTAYALARAGTFPCPVLRVGGSYRVATAELLSLLGIGHHPQGSTPPGGLAVLAAVERPSSR